MVDFLKRSQEAFESSSAYIDTNWRQDWIYSLKAFRNEHAPGSKYLSEEYKARSRLFPPHTRTIIRKNEAAGMQAMFSNREVVTVEPGNPDNPMSVASAAAMKAVLEYRLARTLPTYEIYLGGLQDAQVTGTVCSYQYWEYEERKGKKLKDQPCIDLVPIENIRLDGGASWIDPVNSSPYFAHIIPMYVCDVKAMMKNKDTKTGSPKWKSFADNIIEKALPDEIDQTRQARLGKVQLPEEEKTGVKDFDVVWVIRWFMREGGEDQTYYTLGTEELLTDPLPIDEVYFHGKRPYVIGYSVLETHKTLKNGLPMLTKPLQQESANITNDRIDNVKFVLHKRWMVARGRQVDVKSLVRGAPGAVTLMTDPNTDVKESNWPDVTSSAYIEHDRIKSSFDELAGNFSPSTKVANNAVNDTLGGSKMASSAAGVMTEYLINTVNTTWWNKVLKQLGWLEQYYETDEVVLSICAQNAQLFPRFGLSRITDDLLLNEVSIGIDASMGDPTQRLQKFLFAVQSAVQLISNASPGLNVVEALKEIFANAGYRNGERFFGNEDPRLQKATQMVQQLQGMLEGKQMELQAGIQETQLKLASAEKIKMMELQVDAGRIQGDLQIRQSEVVIDQVRVGLEKLMAMLEAKSMDQEQQTHMIDMTSSIEQARLGLQNQRLKNEGAALQLARTMNEPREQP